MVNNSIVCWRMAADADTLNAGTTNRVLEGVQVW